MERTPEPELMLDPVQARAYAAADFEEPHARFVALLREKLPELPASGRALDLGCGPGDVTIRVARTLPGWTIDALDGAPAMLALAHEPAARAGVASRVRFCEALLPRDAPPATDYDLVFSNSLLHHLGTPGVLWTSITRFGRSGGHAFVMDLLRPDDEAAARALVERYAPSEPDVLRRDFYHSLCAAYRTDEVRSQLEVASLSHLRVERTSDRHFIVWGRL